MRELDRIAERRGYPLMVVSGNGSRLVAAQLIWGKRPAVVDETLKTLADGFPLC